MEIMKLANRILTLSFAALTLLGGCKSEKKINLYSDIYSEKPTIIYVAPINDRMERKVEKYPSDIAYNNELNTSTAYLYQTMARPMLKRGYYVLAPVASRQIAATENSTPKQLRNGSLAAYKQNYGIDAVLLVTIHRWTEENGKWIVFLEYQMRSTKSNVDLMHTWVMATKQVPVNMKSDPIVMQGDKAFAKRFAMDNGTAQRSFLVEKVNEYVLRDLPISNTQRQFEEDRYRAANRTYINYTWTEDGGADVQPISAEEFEQKCFI